METTLLVVGMVVGGIFALLTLFFTFFTVKQQTRAIVERFGKFVRVASPGLNAKIPWIEWVAGRANMRVQELPVEVETKTQDNVFVKVKIPVQFMVRTDKVSEAFYKLQNSGKQITSFVFDVVRAKVPKIKLDDVFEKKDEIADAVKNELAEMMENFGYDIFKAPITDIDPDAKVKAAMNEINAAQRLRIAATEQGEADKILKVKAAEAEAESKKLQGEGIANQRKAIVSGLQESVSLFKEGVPGVTAKGVMDLVLITQYFDTLKELGASSQTKTILIPHSPGALTDFATQIRNAMITADEVGEQIVGGDRK